MSSPTQTRSAAHLDVLFIADAAACDNEDVLLVDGFLLLDDLTRENAYARTRHIVGHGAQNGLARRVLHARFALASAQRPCAEADKRHTHPVIQSKIFHARLLLPFSLIMFSACL